MISPTVPVLDVIPMDLLLLKGESNISRFKLPISNSLFRWDPATGLGTPNYPKMKKLFLSLP